MRLEPTLQAVEFAADVIGTCHEGKEQISTILCTFKTRSTSVGEGTKGDKKLGHFI